MNLIDQDGSDRFYTNECLNCKRCFYLNKTMVIHTGLATIMIPPRLKRRGRSKVNCRRSTKEMSESWQAYTFMKKMPTEKEK